MAERKNVKDKTFRTSIGLKRTIKDSLDHSKSPGQSYDGSILKLIDLWERVNRDRFRASEV